MAKSRKKNEDDEPLFDLSKFGKKEIAELEHQLKLEYARDFEKDFLIPIKNTLEDLGAEKNLKLLRHLGHKIGGHSKFKELTKLGNKLEKKAKEALAKKPDVQGLKKIIKQIEKVFKTEIAPFIRKFDKTEED